MRKRAIIAIAATPIGKLIQNTTDQLTCSTRKAPGGADPASHAPEGAGEQSLHARALGGRVEVAGDGVGDRLDRTRTEALEGPEEDERHHAPGEAAEGRAEEKRAAPR